MATLTFVLFRLTPGDPTLNFLSPSFSEETRAALLKGFGLDRSLWAQYVIYMGNLLRGELGMSFLQGKSVRSLLAEALPNTVILTLVSLCSAYAIGIVAGAFLGVSPWRGGRGGGDPGRARDTCRAGILVGHVAVGGIGVLGGTVPNRRRAEPRP